MSGPELIACLPQHLVLQADRTIADVLGVSRGTVRSHASLGLAKLRSALPHPSEIDGSSA